MALSQPFAAAQGHGNTEYDNTTATEHGSGNEHGTDNHANDTEKHEPSARPHVPGWAELGAGAGGHANNEGSAGTWGGAAAVYQFNGEYGDVGPRVPELETILFGGDHVMRQGSHFQNLQLEVTVEGPLKIVPFREFKDAGLHPVVLGNIQMAKYDHPTPIQAYTLPAVREGMDVVGIAQPGSGKTAAFMIPILDSLMGKAKALQAPRPDTTAQDYDSRIHKVKAEPLVVIIVPTRELAIQIFDEARRMCYRSMLRPCVAYGGYPMGKNVDDLCKGCDVLVATPGRLVHLMDKPDVLTMSRVKFTVIDEADELLQADWEDQLRTIMTGGDTNEDGDHVYMMFSATFPKEVRAMAREYMSSDYVRIHIGRIGSAHRNIRQDVIEVAQNAKDQAVHDLLMSLTPSRTLIFCNSKIGVDLLDDFLYNKGFPTTSIHSGRSQLEREDAMRAFRTGRAPILIATGVSSRGWDIANVHVVINYDLPSVDRGGIDEYIHRIGRTARIGNQGTAYSFYNERNEDMAQDLVNTMVENGCTVPEFLQHLVPEDGQIQFNDDSDDEDAGADNEGGSMAPATTTDAAAEEGFTPDNRFGDAEDAASAW